MPRKHKGTINRKRVDPISLNAAYALLKLKGEPVLGLHDPMTPLQTPIPAHNSKPNTRVGTSCNRVKVRKGRHLLKPPAPPGVWDGRLRNLLQQNSPSAIRQKCAEIKGLNGKNGTRKPPNTSTAAKVETKRQAIKCWQLPEDSKAATSLICPASPSRSRNNQTVQNEDSTCPGPLRRPRRKIYFRLQERRENLEKDKNCYAVKEHSVRCSICRNPVELDKRGKFYPFNWDKHMITNHPANLSRIQEKNENESHDSENVGGLEEGFFLERQLVHSCYSGGSS